jgi:REP element-mobilizing transposase RayT
MTRERCARAIISNVTYFVTWRLARGQQELDSHERALVLTTIKSFDGKRYDLAAYVVMNEHVHTLATPTTPFELQGILHPWESFSAHQTQREHNRIGRVWQDEHFDRIVRDEQEFLQKLKYIVENPWKRWPGIDDCPWVWPLECEQI